MFATTLVEIHNGHLESSIDRFVWLRDCVYKRLRSHCFAPGRTTGVEIDNVQKAMNNPSSFLLEDLT
jgi:hypothetical protein